YRSAGYQDEGYGVGTYGGGGYGQHGPSQSRASGRSWDSAGDRTRPARSGYEGDSSQYGQPPFGQRPMARDDNYYGASDAYSNSYGDPTGQGQGWQNPANAYVPGRPWTPGPAADDGADAPSGSGRKPWITVLILVLLLGLIGGGAFFGIKQYAAPAAGATTFCNDLQAKQYAAAYNLLTSNFQARLTQNQFQQVMT